MSNLLNWLKKNWKTVILGSVGIVILLAVSIFILVLLGNVIFESHNSYNSVRPDYYYGPSNGEFSSNYMMSKGISGSGSTQTLITKNAKISLESENYNLSKEKIFDVIKRFNVDVLNQNENDYNGIKVLNLKLKVNSSKFDDVINSLKNTGKLVSLNIDNTDVTKQYKNYNDKIERYKEQIKKYEKLLNSTTDIEYETKLNSRIDTLENELNMVYQQKENLLDKVDYSYIYLTLTQKPTFSSRVKFNTLSDYLTFFLNTFNFTLVILVRLIAFLIPFFIIFLFYKFYKFLKKSIKKD